MYGKLHGKKLYVVGYHLKMLPRTYLDTLYGNEPHTRVTELKNQNKIISTLIGIEIPSDNGRYYPAQTEPEIKKFQ